ncbi:MAG: DUF2784 domain-containing protein [Rubrivivax sp.]
MSGPSELDPVVARLLADGVLLLHAAVVLFVVGGLLLVALGNRIGWIWVNRRWFRLLHLAAIAVVVGQAWAGVTCPLTTLESWLRMQADGGSGGSAYSGGFIEHWVHSLMYFSASPWVFTLAYSAFGLLVVAAWWRWPSVPPLLGGRPDPSARRLADSGR